MSKSILHHIPLPVCAVKNQECIILFFVLMLCFTACDNFKTDSARVQPADMDVDSVASTHAGAKNQLPQKLIEYLNNQMPGWYVPDTSDYAKSWWSFYDKKQIPYYVTTDLNDDQALDYGFILKDSNVVKLVILLDSANTFAQWVATDFSEQFRGRDIQFGLMIEPPKRIDVITDDRSLILKSNGIALMNFESRSRVYYCDEGKIKVFETEDDPG